MRTSWDSHTPKSRRAVYLSSLSSKHLAHTSSILLLPAFSWFIHSERSGLGRIKTFPCRSKALFIDTILWVTKNSNIHSRRIYVCMLFMCICCKPAHKTCRCALDGTNCMYVVMHASDMGDLLTSTKYADIPSTDVRCMYVVVLCTCC
jgi:hypothetical protein